MSALLDFLRLGLHGLLFAVSTAAAMLGFVACADYRDRGCFSGEAMQCGDAQSVMLLASGFAVVVAIVWFSLGFALKRSESAVIQEAVK